ncbi:MAG TPA: C1 family peptidase [Candidatus Diapherotrites archaeon]|nr:C1 family peptidase [Candidatus Diapherotrites archaeon]
MSRKRNTIIAVITTFIIICIFVIIFLYSKKKENDLMDFPVYTISDEELEYELSIEIPPENLFNDETKDNFEKLMVVEEIADNKNKVKETKTSNKLTGLVPLINTDSQNIKLNDKNYWQDYFTGGHKQQQCACCGVMGVVAALEAYLNKKYEEYTILPIHLSKGYLISYADFMGCSGNYSFYYIKLLTLDGKNKDIKTRNANIKKKLRKEIELGDQFIKGTDKLKTRTQYSIAAGEAPLGITESGYFVYFAYDSCEIVEIDQNNPNFAVTGMDLRILDEIYSKKEEYKDNWEEKRKTLFTKDFCPDSKDKDKEPYVNDIMIHKRNDDFEKIFVENYFKIDNSKDRTKTVKLIKEALEVSPLVVRAPFFESIRKYKGGVWEQKTDDNKEKSYHCWIISGWGVEENSGREYWILKNNWSDNWGDKTFMRAWINDPALNIEKQPIYGFSGEMVTIPGKELNKLLDEVKEEKKYKKAEDLFPNTISPTPDNINDTDSIIKEDTSNKYQNTRYISDNKCTTIAGCIYDKLAVFYGDKQNEFS